jgi:hypothetical protein
MREMAHAEIGRQAKKASVVITTTRFTCFSVLPFLNAEGGFDGF